MPKKTKMAKKCEFTHLQEPFCFFNFHNGGKAYEFFKIHSDPIKLLHLSNNKKIIEKILKIVKVFHKSNYFSSYSSVKYI